MLRNRCPPNTARGATASVVVPSPSSPLSFLPQQYAAPAVLTAHVYRVAGADRRRSATIPRRRRADRATRAPRCQACRYRRRPSSRPFHRLPARSCARDPRSRNGTSRWTRRARAFRSPSSSRSPAVRHRSRPSNRRRPHVVTPHAWRKPALSDENVSSPAMLVGTRRSIGFPGTGPTSPGSALPQQ